ncbi:hypothetical protein JTB14_026044 [Gonioctena quinquepunctata]|nr:hypothetical protein JTB14_026044 [Gonioctena quinquepunctata]
MIDSENLPQERMDSKCLHYHELRAQQNDNEVIIKRGGLLIIEEFCHLKIAKMQPTCLSKDAAHLTSQSPMERKSTCVLPKENWFLLQ